MPARSRKAGQFIETSYFDNIGGLNTSDSPFKVTDEQATGGLNFEYALTGAVQKRRGALAINTVADTQLKTRGIDIFNTTVGTKTVIRAADRKIQAVDVDAVSFTNLSRDTVAAETDVFPVSTSLTTAFAQYNTDTVSLLNFAGNLDGIYSVYSPTKYTKNGSVAPAGSLTGAVTALGGSFQTTGVFRYAVSYTKASTLAESNAEFSTSFTVANVTDSVNLTFSALTSIDTTTYSKINVYRSAVGGSEDFTTGDLIASLTLPVTSYTDTGTATALSVSVPRADSLVLDNSTLPTGTYNTVALWKRRLVTAQGSVLYFSELNVPESWPTVNTITIPSGGPITAVAVISFNTDFGNDEYLAVFKERELWLVKGNDYSDVTLSFIDAVGCPSQSLIAIANGFLTWIDFRGIYLWDGAGKPVFTVRPIDNLFAIDGDLDKSLLQYGSASYFRNRNMVYWFLSSKTYGENSFVIKMDLRLTMADINSTLTGRILDGVFVFDNLAQPVYACKAYLPSASSDERMIIGDDTGFIYSAYQQFSDASSAIDFNYITPFLDLGSPNVAKRFNKVVVWVESMGDWNLTLDYWSGYRTSLLEKSTLQAPISTESQGTAAIWDVAFWDLAYWDDYSPQLTGVVFNLNNTQGNSEGDCIRLRLRQAGIDQPVTIYGYSVFWNEKGMTK